MDLHGFTIITRTMLHIYTSVSILRQKEELGKLKYFTMQKLWSSKDPLKETKILQDFITL
jgi:adenine specific DNA methylase Mod